MNEDGKNNRLSSASYRTEKEFRSYLAEASDVSFRTFESIQALAGTTTCKGVQINELRKFALKAGCWFTNTNLFGQYADRGSENEVYTDLKTDMVFKLNDFRYADDNLNSFFERIYAHNHYFPDCAYDLIGFAQNSQQSFCAVLSQPFIRAEREATEREINETMIKMGFLPQLDGEYFSNGEHDIFDALPNNVLYGIDGHLYFIDTIIYPANADGIQTYRSLSPRYH